MKCPGSIALWFVSCWIAAGAELPTTGIVFLHLRFDSNRVVLVEQKHAPGVLKERRAPEQGRLLHAELLARNGATLWKTTVPDPSVRRVEHEDPARPGNFTAREVTVTNAEFSLRVPSHPRAVAVAFSRVTAPGREGDAPRRENLGRVRLSRINP